jgi:Na+/H+ antiporter NhaD/arsenite permease-like protein
MSFIDDSLKEHLVYIAEVLFFLLGAMTIVEIIDTLEVFSIITDLFKTKKVKLIWILSVLTLFLSDALDNMTTAIVMAALLRNLLKDLKDIWVFAAVIVIAANAGGARANIADVTTCIP